MKNIIKKRIELLRGFVYGESLMGEPIIIDRDKYIGRGRPKNSDYITVAQAQRRINSVMEELIVKRYDTNGTVTTNEC